MLKKVNKATLMATEIAPKVACVCRAVCIKPAENKVAFLNANKIATATYGQESQVQ